MRNVNFGKNNTNNAQIIDNSKKSTKISISIGTAVIIIGIIATIFLFQAPIKNKIIGTWHSNEISDLYIVFSENNSLIVNRSGVNMDGTYIFVENNRVQLNFGVALFNYIIYADVSAQGKILKFDNIEDSSGCFFTSDKITFEMVK